MSRYHDSRRYEDGKVKKRSTTKGDLVFGGILVVAILILIGWGLKQAAKEFIRQTVYDMQKSK